MDKVFKSYLSKQIENFICKKLSSRLCGFRKNCSIQYEFNYMLEKWKSTLGKGKRVGAVFTDLLNPLDTINHEL